jgi:hypothetical protein
MRFAWTIAAAAATIGCGGGSECVADLPLDCAPLYTPTFDQIYTRTLAPTCAVSGASCHAPEGNQGGLSFGDADAAYAALLGKDGNTARVVAGDAACSVVIERLYATDPSVVMPRGAPLSDAERCVFTQWIANGAKR